MSQLSGPLQLWSDKQGGKPTELAHEQIGNLPDVVEGEEDERDGWPVSFFEKQRQRLREAHGSLHILLEIGDDCVC